MLSHIDSSSDVEHSPNKKIKKNVSFFPYNFINLEEQEFELYNPNLKLFELKMMQFYPFGSDFFTINHGKNYFLFFKRLGSVRYFIVQHIDEKVIVGTACAILRSYKVDDKKFNFWYLCDMKIDTEHRKQNLTRALFKNMFYKFSNISSSGYMISMDPGSQQLVHIFKNILPQQQSLTKLLIYSLTVDKMKTIEKYFVTIFKNISYLSLAGKKDLILKSTNMPLEIYHMQHGNDFIPNAKNLNEVPLTASIMFCIPSNSQIESVLREANITTDISATVISWSMDFFDWHSILTSDI
ncbi:MAG: hypothetical protein Satyrvirus46_2 [Satyrvirus sp.]|uniref:Uncharacterized protein n=1 Tax=Satyrvirus sp. TaxID=2487771 RepID=A0A3G5AFA5_9VIRU|nr:MAG: hypothetical protein Satyrvirus46_2 [Satyrvirus sp.]